MTRRAVVLVDGEHYPPVIRDALAGLLASGTQAVAAVVLGGAEKVEARGADLGLGCPTVWADAGDGVDVVAAAQAIRRCLEETGAEVVVDLSDEPVLDHRRRTQLASHVLHAGVAYEGADFRFTPPPRPRVATTPSIAVIGTGKRTGKTAVAGAVTRALAAAGRTPVVVAMGRGGPPEPVVVPAGTRLDAAALLEVVQLGGHAASDFYEDAVTTGAATVGARRCGGGLAGGVAHTNVVAAVEAAGRLPGDVLVLEGSGAAVPPVHADATVLVVPGDCDPELLGGYLGPYRVLLADLVVVTMAEPPRSDPDQVEAVLGAIRSISRRAPLVRTVFRPVPLGPVDGARVFFATTAPSAVTATLAATLETRYGCTVVATSSRLADRPGLRRDLEAAGAFEVLLVELKAAAVDVAARIADRVGARVVFCDNRPHVVGVDEDAIGEAEADAALTAAVSRVARLADERFAAR